jgi:hypothetical protein
MCFSALYAHIENSQVNQTKEKLKNNWKSHKGNKKNMIILTLILDKS